MRTFRNDAVSSLSSFVLPRVVRAHPGPNHDPPRLRPRPSLGQSARRFDHRHSRGVHFGRTQRLVGPWRGARLEINVWDRKARLYALWRTNLSEPGVEQSFREVGFGVANLGDLGRRNTALTATVGGPSAYVAWGHTRRTLEWQRGRGKGTMPMTTMWGIRAEWLSRRVTVDAPSGNTQEFNLGLFLPVFVRLQLPIG